MYDVKPDLRYKTRLECDGSVVNPRGLYTRAAVVKSISIRILDLIAGSQDIKVMMVDIINVFIHASTRENIFTKCCA